MTAVDDRLLVAHVALAVAGPREGFTGETEHVRNHGNR